MADTPLSRLLGISEETAAPAVAPPLTYVPDESGLPTTAAAPATTPAVPKAAVPPAKRPMPLERLLRQSPTLTAKTHDGLPARQNADGSYSTEVSITVTNPRLNGGKPTNIPSLWGGKELSEEDSVDAALKSGRSFQTFGSIDEAVAAAKARSAAGGAGAPTAAADTETPISKLFGTKQPVATPPTPADVPLQPMALLKSGFNALFGGASAVSAASNARSLEVMHKLDAGETVKETDDPYGYQHMTPEQRSSAKQELLNAQALTTANVSSQMKKAAEAPIDPIVAAAINADDPATFWANFKQKPLKTMATITLQSAPQMIPGMIGAAVAGPIGGLAAAAGAQGAGSFAVDYASTILSSLQNKGVDITDKDALTKALNDQKMMEAIEKESFGHAAPVAALDAASMGVAGRTLAPRIIKNILARQAINIPAQAVTQGAMGAAGEALGQVAAGQPLQFGQIASEFLGELAHAPVEIATAAISGGHEQAAQTPLARLMPELSAPVSSDLVAQAAAGQPVAPPTAVTPAPPAQGELFGATPLGTQPAPPAAPTGPQLSLPGIEPAGRAAVESVTQNDFMPQQLSFVDYLDAQRQYSLPLEKLQNDIADIRSEPVLGGWHAVARGTTSPIVDNLPTAFDRVAAREHSGGTALSRVDLTKLDPTKISGSLLALASQAQEGAPLPNVTAPNAKLISRAQWLTKQVQNLFASKVEPEIFATALDRYQKSFASLVAQGLRYIPSNNLNSYDSFVYSESLPQDALVPAELPTRDASVNEANRQYTLTQSNDGINRFAGRTERRGGTFSIDDVSLSQLDWTIDPAEFRSISTNTPQFSITWSHTPARENEVRQLIAEYRNTGDTAALQQAIALGFRMRADESIIRARPHILTVGRLPYDKLRIESKRIPLRRTTLYAHAPWADEARAIVDYHGAEVVPGQTYDFYAHKPGEVLIASSQPNDRPKLNHQAGLLRKILAEFAPDQRIIFTSDPLVFGKDKDVGGGSFSLIAPGLSVIYVSPDVLHGRVDLLANVLWHEAGHLIVFKHWSATEQGVKDQFLFRYEMQLRSALFQTGQEFAPDFRSPAVRVRNLLKKSRAIDVLDNSKTQSEWYNFDEFMAEEIARWASYNHEALSWTDRFLEGASRVLEIVRGYIADHFGVPIERLDPPSDISAWLDSIRTNRMLDETPPSQQGFVAGMEMSRASNAEAEGVAAMPPPPHSGASLATRKLLRQAKLEAERDRRRKLVGLDRYNKMIKHGWNLLQLAAKNRHIAGLQQYVEMIDAWHNFKMRWMTVADAHVRAWNALSSDKATALGEFMFDMANMVYKGAKEAARWPTPAELATLVQKHKLNNQQFALYLDVRDHFLAVLNQIEKSLRVDAQRLFGTGTARHAARMQEIDLSMAALRAQPYFPFARFGDYVTMVRDIKRNKVYQQHYATRFAQKRDFARIRSLYPEHVYTQTKVPEEIKTLVGMPRIFIEAVVDRLNLTPIQRRQVNDMLYELSPAQSFKKHFLQREGLAGYSRDAIRAYANYFFHGANHLARLEYGPLLDNAIKNMEREYKGLERIANVPPIIKRRGIIDFAKEHYNYIMAPASDWPALRSVAFQFYFALNVKQAVINLTQVPLVAYPFLAAQFGDVKAIHALAEASLQLKNMYAGGAKNLTPEFARALSLAVEQGFIDESQAADLADLSEGNTLLRNMPGNGVDRLIRSAGRITTAPFQISEKMNRRQVFHAAYMLGLADANGRYGKELQATYAQQINELLNAGWKREEAIGFVAGKDSVRRTQYEYARWAKPRFMRGPLKANLFTFFNYLQNTLWFAAHSPGNIRYLVLLLASAGLMGMPFAGDASDLAKMIAKLFLGKHFNLELELSKWLHTIGVERPDLILHGLGRESFGMTQVAEAVGLPMPRVDVSGSLSMGHVVPGVRQLSDAVMGKSNPHEMIGAGAQGLAGAAFNIPIALFTSAMSDNVDPMKRWEPAMPIFVRNVSKATRYWQEQQERSTSNARLVAFRRNDPQEVMEIAMQAIGFQPTRLSEKWNTISIQREVAQYWDLRRGLILDHLYHERYVMKNMDGWKEHMERLKKFNAEVPYKEFVINQKQLVDSMRQREIRRIQEEYGMAGGRRNYRINRDVEEVTRGANEPPPRRPGAIPEPVHQQPVR